MPSFSAPDRVIAVFDIGSNAVRLTTYSLTKEKTKLLTRERTLCEMGRDLAQTGHLYTPGVKKAHTALRRYAEIISTHTPPCTGIVAVATEALRRANDGAAFLAQIQQDLGLTIHLLSEGEEGVLGARGVLRELPSADGIVADLGGGSLQLTRVQGGHAHATQSFPLGGLRLLAEHAALDAYIDTHLSKLHPDLGTTKTLYVIGGSWRSFAEIYQARAGIMSRNLQGVHMAPDKVRALTGWIKSGSSSDMEHTLMTDYGLEKSRAELMPYAAHLLIRVMDRLQVGDIVVSSSGLRDGILQGLIDGSQEACVLPSQISGLKKNSSAPNQEKIS